MFTGNKVAVLSRFGWNYTFPILIIYLETKKGFFEVMLNKYTFNITFFMAA